ELVAECVERVFLTRSRKWDRAHYANIELLLLDTIDSLVSNSLKSRNTQRKKHTSEDLVLDALVDANPISAADIDQYHKLRDEILLSLEKMGAKEDEMMIFLARIDDGLIKPEDIRASLGLTESDYHNAFRRLNRKLKEIRTKV